MTSIFRSVFAPVSEEEFLASLSARRFLVGRTGSEDRFKSLMSWDRIQGIIASGRLPQKKLRVTQKRQNVSRLFYHEDGKPSVARIELLMERGASVIVLALAEHDPALNELAEYLACLTQERVSVGAIVTTGSSGALTPHFDSNDVVVLQVEGAKRWKIWEPHVVNPVMGMPTNSPPSEDGRLLFDGVVQAGDLLYLPAGSWHYCENGPDRSLHLGVFLEPITAIHVVRELAGRLQEQELFRRPFTRARLPRNQIEAELKEQMHRLVDELTMDELIKSLRAKRTSDYEH